MKKNIYTKAKVIYLEICILSQYTEISPTTHISAYFCHMANYHSSALHAPSIPDDTPESFYLNIYHLFNVIISDPVSSQGTQHFFNNC